MDLGPQGILFGLDNNEAFINYLIILGKVFIFKAKNSEDINMNYFENIVRIKYKTEKEIARKSENWPKFLKKWEDYQKKFDL